VRNRAFKDPCFEQQGMAGRSMFDVTYLLILAPYAVWIFYVALFYDRLFAHLKEGGVERMLSIFVVLNLIVSVLLGIFVPFAWLIGVATGGIVFSAKMLRLSRNGQISRSARERLASYVVPTILNLILVAIIGIAALIVSLTYVKTDSQIELWTLLRRLAAVRAIPIHSKPARLSADIRRWAGPPCFGLFSPTMRDR
jgi:hypothetical protein